MKKHPNYKSPTPPKQKSAFHPLPSHPTNITHRSHPYYPQQMAKRMHLSVVGLPHYTIWHLYEPSADDIRHMDEMEAERVAREQEEALQRERTEKIEEEFEVAAKAQWESDKEAIGKIGGQGR